MDGQFEFEFLHPTPAAVAHKLRSSIVIVLVQSVIVIVQAVKFSFQLSVYDTPAFE